MESMESNNGEDAEAGLQECRWIGDTDWITSGKQVVLRLYCRAKVDNELPQE